MTRSKNKKLLESLKTELQNLYKNEMTFSVKKNILSIQYVIPSLNKNQEDLQMNHNYIEINEIDNKKCILKVHLGAYSYVDEMDSEEKLFNSIKEKVNSHRSKVIFSSILAYNRLAHEH